MTDPDTLLALAFGFLMVVLLTGACWGFMELWPPEDDE